jgi:hypothetical protein
VPRAVRTTAVAFTVWVATLRSLQESPVTALTTQRTVEADIRGCHRGLVTRSSAG